MDDTTRQSDGFAKSQPGSSRSRDVARWAAARLAAGLGSVYGHDYSDNFGILMYHRVTELISGVVDPPWNVTPSQLRSQLSGLLARGFRPWALSDLLAYRSQHGGVPPMSFVVTFDDGYANNFLKALPVLSELNVPATIFLATNYLDSTRPFPFDDWLATGAPHVPTDSWRPLTTAECEQLLASGLIEFGAHTHRHELYLGRSEEFKEDLGECVRVLERKFGITRPSFALPYGAGDSVMLDVAKQSGVSCCLWTTSQPIEIGDCEFEWGRFDVSQSDTPSVLAAKLSGWYGAVTTTGKKLCSPLLEIGRTASQRWTPNEFLANCNNLIGSKAKWDG